MYHFSFSKEKPSPFNY